MPIPLDRLRNETMYSLLKDSGRRESILARGSDVRADWGRADFQKLSADSPLSGDYVRVECAPGEFIAAWRDPTRPELVEEGGEEPEVLARAVRPLVRPEAIEEFNRVAEALEADSFAAEPAPDPLEAALAAAARELVADLST
jgi:hypothetical protein